MVDLAGFALGDVVDLQAGGLFDRRRAHQTDAEAAPLVDDAVHDGAAVADDYWHRAGAGQLQTSG
ncbi:MAG: hypothetical protein R3F43_00155, partial [bacterium]